MFTCRRRFPIATLAIFVLSSGVAARAQSSESAAERTTRELKELLQAAQAIEDARQAAVRYSEESRCASAPLRSVGLSARDKGGTTGAAGSRPLPSTAIAWKPSSVLPPPN